MDGLSNKDSDLEWPELLELQRVVILAEAGSGKTTEMTAQARQLRQADRYAFYVTVQDLGQHGMEASLEGRGARDFRAWLESGKTAWFLVDSIDEGKLNNIELKAALRNLSRAIDGAERRARIILSSRFTDWDSIRDLQTFEELLPSQLNAPPPAPTADDLLGFILRNEKLAPPPPKIQAAVLLMSPLDEARVREYAASKGAERIDFFIAAIEEGNLWRFARRPLDLEWMVDHWRSSGRLGTLAEMLEASLSARLKESNPTHQLHDPLSPELCRKALERVGAALVFGRAQTVLIPSVEVSLDAHPDAIDLMLVLPDWAATDVRRLLRRSAFDPSTFGRSRIHNDNQGEVRTFLAAQWLRRVTNAANGDPESVRDLLFATSYENDVIRPGMESTAAWLALWDDEVARQVIARDQTLLMNQGDPGSLSLQTRIRVLDSWMANLIGDRDNRFFFDHDKLKRFVSPSLADHLRALWIAHRENRAARELIVMMIWLGRLTACIDVALESALETTDARVERVFAGRAVAEIGDQPAKARLANHIRVHRSTLAPAVVWDAVEHLFPMHLSVEDLLSILDEAGDAEGYGLRRIGGALAEKVTSAEDLGRFNDGVLSRAKRHVASPASYGLDEAYEVFGPAVVGSALKLLKYRADDEVSMQAIDSYLWIYRDSYATRRREGTETALKDELCRTSARRRGFFWRTADRLNGSSAFKNQPLTENYQLQLCGWPGGLELADVEWLLEDMTKKSSPNDRRLCLSSVHLVWQSNKTDTQLLGRIEKAAQSDEELAAILRAWMGPQIEDEQSRKFRLEMEAQKLRHQRERVETEASWRAYFSELREQAEQLRCLPPPRADSVDRRLYSLWRFASRVCAKDNFYSFNNLDAIEPLLGSALTDALFAALVGFWRHWSPTLRTSREPSKQNQISELDCIGIAGISLEAASVVNWPSRLTVQEASLAAQFATIELNGFPPWLNRLAISHAGAVCSVLAGEVFKELDESNDNPHFVGVLDRLGHADSSIRAVVAPRLLEELRLRPNLEEGRLVAVLEAMADNLQGAASLAMANLALERAEVTPDPRLAADYLDAAFLLQPQRAIELLTRLLDYASPADQARLASALLPKMFGDRMLRSGRPRRDMPFDVLKRIVLLAFKTIRMEEDIHRPSNEVYSPGDRDHAEGARSAVFGRLIETPGRATYATLLEMASIEGFPIAPNRLQEFALRRAIEDARLETWRPGDAAAFESECEHAPVTPLALQKLLERRLLSFEHELLHGDFNQARTLKRLTDETLVQNWIAAHLRSVQKSSYGVDRESERADEKKPDIVIKAKASDANLAIEIKVADEMSIEQLEEALFEQLCKKYLRSQYGRHGILLVVYKKRRSRGWQDPARGIVQFEQVTEYLRAKSRAIAAAAPDAPQPVISTIDVSSLEDDD